MVPHLTFRKCSLYASLSARQKSAYNLFRVTVRERLLSDLRLSSIRDQAAIVAIGSHTFDCGDLWSDYDILVIIGEPIPASFDEVWTRRGGAWPSIVSTGPPEICTKIRPHTWLLEGSDCELAIMTFIVRHAWVFEDPGGVFAVCSARLSSKFQEKSQQLLDFTLAQLRNSLYQLEQAETRGETLAMRLYCALFIEQLLQTCFLADAQPFPYRKWLAHLVCQTRVGRQWPALSADLDAGLHSNPSVAVGARHQYVRLLKELSTLGQADLADRFEYSSQEYYQYL